MFRRSFFIVILVLLVSYCHSATTYYEVWRNTTNDPSTAVRIEKWLTANFYDDDDPSLVPGQQYYYWIRALSCETMAGQKTVVAGAAITNTITCPVATTENCTTPVLAKTRIYNSNPLLDCDSGSLLCELRDYDGLWIYQTLGDPWQEDNVRVTAIVLEWEKTWSKDVNIAQSEPVFGAAEVYFYTNYNGFEPPYDDISTDSPQISVTIRPDSDPGPVWNSISQGDYPDKIHLVWNPVSDVCSEIDFNTPVGTGWTMPIISNVTLTVNASGSGQVKVDGVTRSLPWQGTYTSGTVVNLQAVQSTGWTFGYWSGSINSNSNPINVQLVNSATITANFLNTANMAEVSFELEPSADAYVSSCSASTNHGSSNILVGCNGGCNYESMVKFNLPTIASGTSIKSNSAWLEFTNNGGAGIFQLSVMCNSGSWSESSVTWNQKPGYYSTPNSSINVLGDDSGTTYLLPVQLHLNEWINNQLTNNGFRLRSNTSTGDNYAYFRSKEYYLDPPPTLSFTVYETVSSPTSISGSSTGSQGDSLSFAAGGASSNLNHSLQYRFDWGDGDQSSWGSASRSKTYNAVGQYGIRAQARCSSHTDAVSNWSPVLKTVTVAASSRSISGYVRDPGDNGIANVTVFANNGGGSTATNSSGYYSLNIPYNWSGRITPMKTGVEFSPVYKEYSFVTSNQTNQNYTGISYAVQVIITPFLANDDGAMWRIDSGTWRPSGYTEENLSAGTHTVDFLSTTNWNAPDSRTVSITGSQSIAAHYYHIADLDTDDKINLLDYSLLSDGWQDSPCSSPDWCGGVDINRSGTVGIDDLLIMAEHWLDGSIVSEGTSLLVANHSFEDPIIDPSTNPMLSIPTVSLWVEHDTDEIFGGNVGTFLNLPSTNPASILNVDGNQLAYIGGDGINALYQDLSATYHAGKIYEMTVGVCYSTQEPPLEINSLQLQFYYIDPNTLNRISIKSSYCPLIDLSSYILVDYSVLLPTVKAGDPWAGSNIGISIQDSGPNGGFWHVDNIRVTEYEGLSGSGTISDPFLISTRQQLESVNNNPSAHYRLVNDIDLSGHSYYYSPVIETFEGEFDGNGHKIFGLIATGDHPLGVGLFGYVHQTGHVFNLGIESATVGGYWAGALAGTNSGTISTCHASVVINNSASSETSGGLVAYNEGIIQNCSAHVELSNTLGGMTLIAGGIVGANVGGNISGSYVDGAIEGEVCGGLIGYNFAGVVSNCFADTNVNGVTAEAGGFCGFNDNSSLNKCYAIGHVVGITIIGGFCGTNVNGSTITNSYWDVQTSGVGNPGDNNYGAIGKTTAEMKTQSTFTGWDFTNIWNIEEGSSYPYFKN